MYIECNFNILDLLFPVIYKITIGTHQYIGSTKRCAKVRIKEHIRLLIKGKHYNSIMQNWFSELNMIKVDVLEYVIHEDVCDREQYWINKINPDINIIKNVARY